MRIERNRCFRSVLAFVAFACAVSAADIVLLPDRVWTADGDASHHGWGVLVRDGAIAAVGPTERLMRPPTRRASNSPARR